MPKLITEDELKEWVEDWFVKNTYYHPYSKSNNIPIPELYDILKRIPTVDAEPIRQGHWIDCKCSKCGAEAITEWNETGGAWVMTPYCPFCGAKMDEDEQA